MMQFEELSAMIQKHPIYIPIAEVAAFLHIAPESLRASIDQGRCPFGLSWTLGERSSFKVPTIAFYCWLTKETYNLA